VRRLVSFRDFDWVLLGIMLMICALSILQIYSATVNTKFVGAHWKQMTWLAIGLVIMFIVSRISYQFLLENVHWAYIAVVLMLIAVKLFGKRYLGAQRWLDIGPFHMQPSEWVKIILVLAVARYFSDGFKNSETSWADIFKVSALVGVPMALVLKQPDLGTSLTYVPVLVMGLFLGGLKFKQAAIIIVVGLLALVPIYKYGLKDYQRERLTSFMNPEADPRGSGYQVQQSLIAVGSGGLIGKGVAQGTQTQGEFLPIPHTDFIFASLAEEHGFVGALALLLLYFMLLMRLIHNAQTAPDRAGTFIVMGIAGTVLFHIMVNVGMVIGLMPVTGIPLPLFSYGGSTMVFICIALGVVHNIRMRRFVN
jgi:rod shape determining protein RodA